jgi:hypothetical protein
VGASIALGAWSRVRGGNRRQPPLPDLAIVATIIAIFVVGAFDAVLLLPVPTYFAWTVIGALATAARPIREVALSPLGRRRLVVTVALLGSLLLLQAASQVTAMVLANSGDRGPLELAAKVDPGSYRMHMLLAQQWRAARRCDRARTHAEYAEDLFPNHPAPKAVLRACRGTR